MTMKFDWSRSKTKSAMPVFDSHHDTSAVSMQIADSAGKHSQNSTSSTFFARPWSWMSNSKKSGRSSAKSDRSYKSDTSERQGTFCSAQQTSARTSHASYSSYSGSYDDDDERERQRQREALMSFTFKFGRTYSEAPEETYGISPRSSRRYNDYND